LDTNPPGSDSGSGVNMFGSGEGYRPGQQSYRIDQLAVPASRFMEEINTGMHGGSFGLLEMAARMSAVEIEWHRTWEWGTTSTMSDGTVRVNTHSLTLTMGVFRIENWAVNLSAFQNGRPAPLTDEENEKLDTRIKKLVDEKLGKKDCKDFLVRQLGQAGYDKLIATLENQGLRYSAERSTDITVEQAELFGANARQSLTILSDKKNTKDARKRQEYKDKLEQLNWSVSKLASRIGVHAILGRANGQPVVYYNSFKKITTIVHENMHISTGLGDVGLAKALGLKDEKGNYYTETYKASASISQALIDKGCTN
jgi:hypothetical protein